MDFEIRDGGACLRVGATLNLPALWLLDNGRGASTRDPKNGQRLIDLSHADADVRITDAHADAQGLHLEIGGHSSFFDHAFLARLTASDPAPQPVFRAGDLKTLPTIAFDAFLNDPEAEAAWLDGFSRYGFGRFTRGPCEPGALFNLIEQFGFVRETNYGRHFEVRTEPNPTNLAYTGMGLPPHTDNPYREPVPTLQLLYCLENSATGGESQVVDGFAVAEALRAENPAAFDLLTKIDVTFAFEGQAGVQLRAHRPLIELDGAGRLRAVCYNTRSMQPLMPREGLDLAAYMAAYHRLGTLMNDRAFWVEFRLGPGEAFLVNNRRVLHARAGFKADGHRWLQGAYADVDSLESRRRVLAGHSK